MRVLIIHNTASGFGSDAIFQFERHLLREGDECVMRILRKDAPDLGKSLLKDVEKFDLVAISGGDGTVATLLTHLKYRKVRTCILRYIALRTTCSWTRWSICATVLPTMSLHAYWHTRLIPCVAKVSSEA